jgi:hypothetical protein
MKYGETLKKTEELPDFVHEIQPPSKYNGMELEQSLYGDVEAMFMIDLDTDEHEPIVDEAALVQPAYKIFNAKYSDTNFVTDFEQFSPLTSIGFRSYKNIQVIACPEAGLKGGYTLPNLYIIEINSPSPIFQFLPDINQDQEYGNLAADVFTGLNTLYTRHQEVRDMFNLIM